MPSYAHLATQLLCPFCGSLITDEVWFQWGFCERYSHDPETFYHIGDQIRWKKCKGDLIPTWAYFGLTSEANIGDPSIENLVVRDTSPLFQGGAVCQGCNQRIDGAAIEIRSGRIDRAWIYSNNQINEASDIYIIGNDQIVHPMPQWNDHEMQIIEDC